MTPIKVGDEVAIDASSRFESGRRWQISKVSKITPSGKFRTEHAPQVLWKPDKDNRKAYGPRPKGWGCKTAYLVFVTEADAAACRRKDEWESFRAWVNASRGNSDRVTDEVVTLTKRIREIMEVPKT